MPINRSKIFGPAEFTADVRFFRRFAGNRRPAAAGRRAVIVVEIRMADTGRDYEIPPMTMTMTGITPIRKKKERIKRASRIRKEMHRSREMGVFVSSGLLLARHWENVVGRQLVRRCAPLFRRQSSLSIRESKSYRFTDAGSCVRTFP